MALPITPLARPAVLAGQSNGRLDPAILEEIPGLAGGPTIRLVAPAARAWRAMTAAAQRDGIVLKASGPADSYRPYAVQERIFRQRYTTSPLAGRPSRTWDGARWWQKPGTAAAAVPGTSNHGWALAVDTGTELDGDAGTESIDDRTLDWLLAHAATYGWSWELQSERWHIRYVAGDSPPPAVTAFDPDQEDDMFTDKDRQRLEDVHTALQELHRPNHQNLRRVRRMLRSGLEHLGVPKATLDAAEKLPD